VPSEWKINTNKLLRNTEHTYRTFKAGTGITERKIVPLWGHWETEYFSELSERKNLILSKDFGLCHTDIQVFTAE